MLNQTQRILFAEKFMDLGNLALAGLAIGQLISEKMNWQALIIGIASYILLGVIAYFCEKGIE